MSQYPVLSQTVHIIEENMNKNKHKNTQNECHLKLIKEILKMFGEKQV